MLTRLYVDGFKNLVKTEVRFGPFTCIAGFNGVGKSNVFDAIQFLRHLADHPFLQAAELTRGGGDLHDLFTAGGDGRMVLECDLIIPRTGHDDFHQPAEASQTFLTYRLELAVDEERDRPRIRLEHESLEYIPKGRAKERLGFPASDAWRDSVIPSSTRRAPFIKTEQRGGECVVRLSTDKMQDDAKAQRGGGRPTDFLARTLPRTVLSAAQNADEARTAVLARAEMRSWSNLQLEPSALREPDELQAPTELDPSGWHLPSTLYRIATDGDPERVYAEVSNRLAELVNDVQSVRVHRDDARRLLQLTMTDRRGVELRASSLSDGTLRFVALSVLELDSSVTGLLCLEEPENGIHPERIDAMMRLLSDMATDVEMPVDESNPLRQLIISTHSPVVAARVPRKDLVVADHHDAEGFAPGTVKSLVLRPLRDEWRHVSGSVHPVSAGDLIHYLGSLRPGDDSGSAWEDTLYGYVGRQLELFGSVP